MNIPLQEKEYEYDVEHNFQMPVHQTPRTPNSGALVKICCEMYLKSLSRLQLVKSVVVDKWDIKRIPGCLGTTDPLVTQQFWGF